MRSNALFFWALWALGPRAWAGTAARYPSQPKTLAPATIAAPASYAAAGKSLEAAEPPSPLADAIAGETLEAPPASSAESAAVEASGRFDGAPRLNIFAGRDQGGYGDIAANVVMARELERVMPGAAARLVAREDARVHAKLKVLVPGYDPKLADQRAGGLRFIAEAQELPPADAALGFSIYAGLSNVSGPLSRTSPLSVAFREFSDLGIGHADLRRGRELVLPAGAGLGGFYIAPERPPPPMSRAELLRSLGERQDVLLGFSYTHRDSAALMYARAAAQWAGGLAAGKTLLLVMNEFGVLDSVKLPPNIRLKRLRTASLALSEAAIAHSDVAVMTTGDVSLSLALQHEKPFFYEMNSWKDSAITGLRHKLERHGPRLKEFPLKQVLELAPSQEPGNAGVKATAMLFGNQDFADAFRTAVAAARKSLSLPLFVRDMLRLFAGMPAGDEIPDLRQKLGGLPTAVPL